MADPAFYRREGDEIVRAKVRLEEMERDLAVAFERWEELEARTRPLKAT